MSLFNTEDLFLVTGASSGIGRAIALKLNESGAAVLANGRDSAKLEETRSMAKNRESLIPLVRDLGADMPSLAAWLKSLTKKFGALKGLACCAGITWNAPLSFYPLPRVREIFDICCHAPLVLGGAFCGARCNSGPGAAVVNIAAAAAIEPNPGQGVYAAAKAALVAGSKCLAKEAAPRGVRVNCISPGLVEGPMLEATCAQLGQDFLARESALYPLGLGKPEYVAELAVFLLSGSAAWITGQNFIVSGGR